MNKRIPVAICQTCKWFIHANSKQRLSPVRNPGMELTRCWVEKCEYCQSIKPIDSEYVSLVVRLPIERVQEFVDKNKKMTTEILYVQEGNLELLSAETLYSEIDGEDIK